MSQVNVPLVEVEEVTSVLTPADGVSVYQALHDAALHGWTRIEIIGNEALITWFKKEDS